MNRRDFLKQTAGASTSFLVFAALGFDYRCFSFGDDPQAFTGKERFDQLLKMARQENWAQLPIGRLMGAIGMALRSTPYVNSTLELYDDREVCSINLLGLDCVTFFENALAFARMLKTGRTSPEEMLKHVAFMRYRDGKVADYASRLHYTSDWLFDNDRKGVVKMITKDLPGAERFARQINFMSTHPASYRQLKANPDLVPAIAGIEREINAREVYFLPKEKVKAAETRLETGDLIGITTAIDGLDCSHTGLCYRDENGKLRLLHASTTKKEVVLDVELSAYLAGVAKHTGIMVARPLEPMIGKQ
jgi:hypothetical protein